MNKIIKLGFFIIIGSIILFGLNNEGYTYSNGGPIGTGLRGFTGSPLDNGETCATSGCHVGASVVEGQEWIVSNIPKEGYVLDSTYILTIKAIDSNASRFGFMASVQSSAGGYAGTLFSTINDQVQVIGSNKYVTHTIDGIGQGSIKTWSFNWIAPSMEGTGPVTFYAAINAANGNGLPDGDQIYLTSLEIPENGKSEEFKVYPNPFIDKINIISDIESDWPLRTEIINSNGQVVYSTNEKFQIGQEYQMDLSELRQGLYYLQIDNEMKTIQNKLIKVK